GSGAHRDGDIEVGVGVDQPESLRPFEDEPQPPPTGGDDLGPVARTYLGLDALLQHRADKGEPTGARHATLEVGQLGHQICEGVGAVRSGRLIGEARQGSSRELGLAGPAPVEGLPRGPGLLSDRCDAHGLVSVGGQMPGRGLQHPVVDARVSSPTTAHRSRCLIVWRIQYNTVLYWFRSTRSGPAYPTSEERRANV